MSKVYKRFFEIVTQEKDKLAKQYGVRRIGLFGSSVRGDATDDSDADVLVDFAVKTFDAVVRNLEVIGEAAKKISVVTVWAEDNFALCS